MFSSFCNDEKYVAKLEEQLSKIKDLAQLPIDDLLSHMSNEAIVSLLAIGKNIEDKYKINNIKELSEYLNVPAMTEVRSKRKILIALIKGDSQRLLKKK